MSRILPFVHLEVRSHYSLRQSLVRESDLPMRAAALGMEAVALTDELTLAGSWRFERACREAGVSPIFGLIVRVSPPRGESSVTLLAENVDGWRSLVRISSLAGRSESSMLTPDALWSNRRGLIALVGCPRPPLGHACHPQDLRSARETLGEYQDLFGPDRLYLKVCSGEGGIPDLRMGLQAVAVHEVRALTKGDAKLAGMLLGRADCSDSYLMSPLEMSDRWRVWPAALERTIDIAALCSGLKLPRSGGIAPTLGTMNAEIQRSLHARRNSLDDRSIRRVDGELHVFTTEGGLDALALGLELARRGREMGIRIRLAGTWNRSLAAHLLGLTDVDPRPLELEFKVPRELVLETDAGEEFDAQSWLIDQVGGSKAIPVVHWVSTRGRIAVANAGRALGVDRSIVNAVADSLPAIARRDEPRDFAPAAELARDAVVAEEMVAAAGILDRTQRMVMPDRRVIAFIRGDEPVPTWELDGDVTMQYDRESCGAAGLTTVRIHNSAILHRCSAVAREAGLSLQRISIDNRAFKVLRRGAHAGLDITEAARALILEVDVRCMDDLQLALHLATLDPAEASSLLDRRRAGDDAASQGALRKPWLTARALDVLYLAALKGRHPREFMRVWLRETTASAAEAAAEARALRLGLEEQGSSATGGQRGHL